MAELLKYKDASDDDEQQVYRQPASSRSPYLKNLADVLEEHGIDAKTESHMSAFVAKVAQLYHSNGT